MAALSGKSADDSGGELLSPEALAILDALPSEKRSIVLQSFFQNIHLHDSSEVVSILAHDRELGRELVQAAIRDGEIERQYECKIIEADIETTKSAMAQQGLAIVFTWAVVILSIVGALVGYYLKPGWEWLVLAGIGVGGPTAVQIIARNTSINVNSTNQPSPPDENSK
jgi:hypothetical protein